MVLLVGDLVDLFLLDEGTFSSSEPELLDEDDSEEVSSLSDSLLLDIAELVSISMDGLYMRFTVSKMFLRQLLLKDPFIAKNVP